jgi:hypothetical protein
MDRYIFPSLTFMRRQDSPRLEEIIEKTTPTTWHQGNYHHQINTSNKNTLQASEPN